MQSKAIIRAFYGRDAGAQLLRRLLRRRPRSVDGGAALSRKTSTASSPARPPNNWSHLFTAFVWNEHALLATPDSAIPPAKLPVIQRAVMAACDSLDGVADGLIENPRACRFDPSVLLCKGADGADCSDRSAGRRAQEDLRRPEESAHRRTASLSDSRPGPKPCPAAGALDHARERRQARSSSGSATAITARRCSKTPSGTSGCSTSIATCASAMRKRARSSTRPAPDLRSFRAGGREADSVSRVGRRRHSGDELDRVLRKRSRVSSPDIRMRRTTGTPPVDDFYRLFMVPGMAHCGGGAGPNSFGNGGAGDKHRSGARRLRGSRAVGRTRRRSGPAGRNGRRGGQSGHRHSRDRCARIRSVHSTVALAM